MNVDTKRAKVREEKLRNKMTMLEGVKMVYGIVCTLVLNVEDIF